MHPTEAREHSQNQVVSEVMTSKGDKDIALYNERNLPERGAGSLVLGRGSSGGVGWGRGRWGRKTGHFKLKMRKRREGRIPQKRGIFHTTNPQRANGADQIKVTYVSRVSIWGIYRLQAKV